MKHPTVAYLTAGAAGMYCGSCLHDNTLAAALHRLGCDIQLIPTYTPIRTDEEDTSIDQVFFGGINVYLQEKVPLFRYLPRFLDRWLDRPGLINWLASGRMSTDGAELGPLTVSMLRGEAGHQCKEVYRLVDWLERHVHPDVINLSNVLIAGCVPQLKRRLGTPIVVTLQGDDLFLGQLPEPYQATALQEIQRLAEHVDTFLVFSQYYADQMAGYLGVPKDKFAIVPLGIRLDDYREELPATPADRPPTIGYLARVAPEKGLHVLVDAFCQLRQQPHMQDARLRVAGWLGEGNRAYFDDVLAQVRQAGLADAFEYLGTIERAEKLAFLQSLDVLSVPTTYREPKGLFVLEAVASGVPVVQPEHGAFPELLAATGGGRLVRPNDPSHLAETFGELFADRAALRQFGETGRRTVHQSFGAERMATETLAVYQQLLGLSRNEN